MSGERKINSSSISPDVYITLGLFRILTIQMNRLLLIFSILLLSVGAFAQQPVELTIDSLYQRFPDKWPYILDDDPAYAEPEYNDSGWVKVRPRLPFEDSAAFEGIAWFRMRVRIDSTLTNEPIAVKMTHDGASEIYVDGRFMKKHGVINGKDSSEYYDPIETPFIIVFDTVGEHVIAVRYANYAYKVNQEKYQSSNSGFTFRPYVANRLLDDDYMNVVVSGFIIAFLIGFSIGLALLHLFLFLYNRSEKSNLYLSLFALGLAGSFLFPYIMSNSTDPVLNMQVDIWMLVSFSTLLFSLTGLVYELFSRQRWRFYVTSVLCVTTVIIGYFTLVAGVVAFVVVFFIIIMEAFVMTIIAINHKVRGAKIIGAGILFFCIFFFTMILILALNSGSVHIGGGEPLAQLLLVFAILAIISIPISMSVYLAWKFASINKDLNKQLKQVQELSDINLEQEQEKKRILETQNERLEQEVSLRTSEIVAEKKKSDELLLNILPQEVAEELKERGTTEAKYFDHVSVLFTDFVDFTKAGERLSPQELVDELHTCFKAFDQIISKYEIEKIKTIGDAYLAVCGLPHAVEEHAIKTVSAAIEIRDFMVARKKEFPNKSFDVRIGIHSGPVVAGIVGVKKFAYDIWGDTVNTAARMESSSEADKINISHYTYELIKDHFECSYRGMVTAKNKGELRMYFVEGKK